MKQENLDRQRRRALGLAGAAAAVAALPDQATAQTAPPESRLETVLKRGKLLVATFSTSPPLCFTDEKGELVGFEIDITRMIAKGLFDDESKVEFLVIDTSGRWPAVLSGRADFGIASTTIYPDRAVRVCFSAPYMDSGVSVLVRKDANIKSFADLNDGKFTLANLTNPQQLDRARRFLPNTKLITFETPSAQMLAVKSGQAQAMQMDTPVVEWYVANDDTLAVLPAPFGNVQNNAMFLKPGDFTWWLYLTTVVNELRTGSRYDAYAASFQKWFGHPPPPQRFYAKT